MSISIISFCSRWMQLIYLLGSIFLSQQHCIYTDRWSCAIFCLNPLLLWLLFHEASLTLPQKHIVRYLLFLQIKLQKKITQRNTRKFMGNCFCFAGIITNTHGLGFAIYMVIYSSTQSLYIQTIRTGQQFPNH